MGVDTLQLLVLDCADLDASVAFYAGGLGLPLLRRDKQMAVLRAGLLQIVLEVVDALLPGSNHPNAEAAPPAGVAMVFKVSAMDELVGRLHQFGLQLHLSESAATGRLLSVRDPDGRELQLAERPL